MQYSCSFQQEWDVNGGWGILFPMRPPERPASSPPQLRIAACKLTDEGEENSSVLVRKGTKPASAGSAGLPYTGLLDRSRPPILRSPQPPMDLMTAVGEGI